jgi:hypothetical protein
MESPDPASKHAMQRPANTIADPNQPHCADHANFHSECVVCRRACANFQPYPMRKSKPVSRSFGFTDNITEEKLRALDPKFNDIGAGDPEYSLSFVVLRALWRLIWPF